MARNGRFCIIVVMFLRLAGIGTGGGDRDKCDGGLGRTESGTVKEANGYEKDHYFNSYRLRRGYGIG
ncbi:MAG: hypothetical protein J6Z49_00455 [Kiritimatiellae bacterium]|nr:hypothetical protein [Kiritimatiellia bacterium]